MVLPKLEKAIFEGDINSFRKILSNSLEFTSKVENSVSLKNYCNNASNPIGNTNLVILACKHNKLKILEYLFENDSRILNNLFIAINRDSILPEDEDEEHHNAFYYAIRSNNTELLDTLINKWPDHYFATHLKEMDEILSRAYEELKLKNVPLSDEIEIFVQSKLIHLRFFSNTNRKDKNFRADSKHTRDRIELMLQNITLLKINYSNTEEVDEKFLFVAKSIAQHIHILKRPLKSTYGRLPWEEIEFCLVSFISSHIKRQEINVFYRAILNKNKIINNLDYFAKKLEDESDILTGLRGLTRDQVVSDIIKGYPQFEGLYDDYRYLRDMTSLEKINDYIKLALSVDPQERKGQLVITRALQVIGEHLKNTLESPKLSNTTSNIFLLSLPNNTRKIIMDTRDSLSHGESLSKRIEIEENTNVKYFKNIQSDIENVGDVITDFLYKRKFETINVILEQIANCEDLDKIKEITGLFSAVELDEMFSRNFKMVEEQKLAKAVQELSDNITDKTKYEIELFDKINSILIETQSGNIRNEYIARFGLLKELGIGLSDMKSNLNAIRGIEFVVKEILKDVTPKMNPTRTEEISSLCSKILDSVESRKKRQLHEVNRLTRKIYYIVSFEIGDIKWIEELQEKLNERDPSVPPINQRKAYNLTQEKYTNQLALKLSELKSILSNNSLNRPLIEMLSIYKSDRKLQAVVEMLVLDIMSILGTLKNYLENNLLYLDDNAPLLNGQCLRNHLAHDNAVVDVLLSDPSMAAILNAKKLVEENIQISKKKIGKLIIEDTLKLKEKYEHALSIITNQKRMFAALEDGNLEILKDCLKKGTDINARNINLWSTLQFAAKGPSVEVIKFILNQNLNVNVKDINGHSLLHIAAAHGRSNIVEFLIKEASLNVDDLNNRCKTPLHVAVENGHQVTVEELLKNGADTLLQDMSGLLPVHYAIRNNRIDIAILLKKDVNVKGRGGCTPLYEAAESGHLELVNFLLQNKANVNARNDSKLIPLHAAAFNGDLEIVNALILEEVDINARATDGCTPLLYAVLNCRDNTTALNDYLEVVNALILKGADVNAPALDGCSPLLYDVQNGHRNIYNILLKRGSNINVVDKTYNIRPLHLAAVNGHDVIVQTLLKNSADASAATAEGITPLHFAADFGRLEVVSTLIKNGVDIHVKDKNNWTPLHLAVVSGRNEVAESLIRSHAEINAKGNDNLTPLHLAAREGHKDVTALLIKHKAEVNAETSTGGTPLHAAAIIGNKDIIDLLIQNNAKVNAGCSDGTTPLHEAARYGNWDAADFLIKSEADVNVRRNDGVTPLFLAVTGGHRDIVNVLVKNNADVELRGTADFTPLCRAVVAGHKEIVEILAANGANVNSTIQNLTPLLFAVTSNKKEIVEVLLAHGANLTEETSYALSMAISSEYIDIVEMLLQNEDLVNMKGLKDGTPLHWAAMTGHKKIVNALIKKGADVNAIAMDNATPLHLAVQRNQKEVVEILIAGGADVNAETIKDIPPLHMAAAQGNYDIVKVLLANQANSEVKDNQNRSAVELAVFNGNLEVVKILLQHRKTDLDAKGFNGYTLLHIASQENHLDIVKYLIHEGSNVNARNAIDGNKSIHVAAANDSKETVEFFLRQGMSIDDTGASNQTLLHYAANEGHFELARYLITQGADVNIKDDNGLTFMHLAAQMSL